LGGGFFIAKMHINSYKTLCKWRDKFIRILLFSYKKKYNIDIKTRKQPQGKPQGGQENEKVYRNQEGCRNHEERKVCFGLYGYING
jgi:hypothetical protein